MNINDKKTYSLWDYKQDCWKIIAEKILAGDIIVSPVVKAFLESPITINQLIAIDYTYEDNHKITRTSRIIKIKSKFYRVDTLTNNDTHQITYPNQIIREVYQTVCWKNIEEKLVMN